MWNFYITYVIINAFTNFYAAPHILVNNTGMLQRVNYTRPISVGLCLIIKDENKDLLEWIDYHKSIGVTNIIIVDDNSSTSALNDIMPHVWSGFLLHYSYLTRPMNSRNNQMYAYNYCIKNFASHFSHMGFIDTDEFIVLVNRSSTILDLIEPYRAHGGLTLNWKLIGSNGHIKRPNGGVLKNYYKCKKNKHVKTIVNTEFVIAPKRPHDFSYHEGFFAVDVNYNRVDGPFNDPKDNLYQVAYVNHYILKSYEDFNQKRLRGSGDGGRIHPSAFQVLNDSTWDACELLRPHNGKKPHHVNKRQL